MDEKKFKKHLSDLVHGHHHPDEHDWGPGAENGQSGSEQIAGAARGESPVEAKRKPPKRARASRLKHKRASG